MRKNDNASERTIWVASVDATHTRAESAKGKGETMVGAKEIVSCKKKGKHTVVKHADNTAAKLTAPFSQSNELQTKNAIAVVGIGLGRGDQSVHSSRSTVGRARGSCA